MAVTVDDQVADDTQKTFNGSGIDKINIGFNFQQKLTKNWVCQFCLFVSEFIKKTKKLASHWSLPAVVPVEYAVNDVIMFARNAQFLVSYN